MTLQELIERAIDIANQGRPTAPTLLAAEVAAEPYLPIVFQRTGEMLAASFRTRTQLQREKELTVVNGLEDLDEDVLTRYLYDAHLRDPTDGTKLYSYAPFHMLASGQLDQRLGHFALRGENTLQVVEPDEEYDPTSGPTVALTLTTACAPLVPADITDDVEVTAEVATVLITELATAISQRK